MVKKLLQVVVLLFVSWNLTGKDFVSWDFESCEIKDILFMISEDMGISITADDTVNGKGSLKFAGDDFDIAFDSFLEENRLFVKKNDAKWVVSRFLLEKNEELYSLDVCDLFPLQIVEKLSLYMEEVINYDQLPSLKVSVHLRNVSKQELLDCIAARFGSYIVKTSNRQITFSKINEVKRIAPNDGFINIQPKSSGELIFNIKNSNFFDVLEKLFDDEICSYKYCLLTEKDSRVLRTDFVAGSFRNGLRNLCSQNGYEYIELDNIFYFVKTENDKTDFIYGSKGWKKFPLKIVSSDKMNLLISKRFEKIKVIEVPGKNELLCNGTENLLNELEKFISEIDILNNSYLIVPKYLSNQDFVNKLPPEFDRSKITCKTENGPVYFCGSEYEYEQLCKQMHNFDVPPVCIKYDLLILQYDESVQNNWATSFSANRLALGDRNNLGVQIGSVMSLNLNVVSSFGLTMAANIQSSIEENNTKVFADTVLYGISGKPINFQNTSTYRYRDNNLDPETGKPIYTGVTREISSGIKLEICGWVSSEGMITSNVTASVSRQGVDTSSATGNPPPTTEKIVTTEVCGKSGEPIILSGLIQNSSNEEKNRKPFLSKLPIVGLLFKNTHKTKEKSQMVIFLVPHVSDVEKQSKDFITEEWANKRISNLHIMEL